jgi:hypothetical protein
VATHQNATSGQSVGEATSVTYANPTQAGSRLGLAIDVVYEELAINAVSGITVNGSATGVSRLDSQSSGAAFARAEMWQCVAPPVGGNIVVTLSFADTIVSGAKSATDVNQTTPLRTAAKNSSASATSLSATVLSLGANDLCVDVLAVDGSKNVAEGADQQNRWEIAVSGKVTGAGSTQPASLGGVMSWSWTGAAPCALIASAFIHDGGAGGTAFTQDVGDTVSLSESLTRRVDRAIAESIALSEALTPQAQKLLVDAISLTESVAKQIARTMAEALSLSEQHARQAGKGLAETVALSENLSAIKTVLKPLAETVTLTENLQRLVGKAQAESLALTEDVHRLTARVLEETVSLTEDQVNQSRRVIAESLAFSEALVTAVVKLHQDSEQVVLTEAQARQVGRAIQESLGLTETRIVRLARTVAEAVSLTEMLGSVYIPGTALLGDLIATSVTSLNPLRRSAPLDGARSAASLNPRHHVENV